MLKIGIIVCAHGNKNAVARLCKAYARENADIIAFCGDLGDDFAEINSVLSAAKARVPVIAFPGSHEPAEDFAKAMKKHPRVINGLKKRRVTLKGHDIVILPGSNVNTARGSFRLLEEKRDAQKYRVRGYRVFVVEELKKLVRLPAKTIVLCHDPPKCAGIKAIDVAYSGIVTRTFILKPRHFGVFDKQLQKLLRTNSIARLNQKGQIITEPYASKLAKLGYPVSVKHRNVGLTGLRRQLKRLRVPFFACGHIHEAGQRAVNSAGRQLKQGSWSSSVWHNAAPAVKGKGGMLIIENGKATFENITVKP
jgi:Icc-related predicted phosphoesterase